MRKSFTCDSELYITVMFPQGMRVVLRGEMKGERSPRWASGTLGFKSLAIYWNVSSLVGNNELWWVSVIFLCFVPHVTIKFNQKSNLVVCVCWIRKCSECMDWRCACLLIEFLVPRVWLVCGISVLWQLFPRDVVSLPPYTDTHTHTHTHTHTAFPGEHWVTPPINAHSNSFLCLPLVLTLDIL